MKIKVLGAFGSEGLGQRPSAFLVNDRILVDAGTVPGALTVDEQLEVEHALLSHPHLDHVVGLAFLTDTLASAGARRPVTATSVEPVIQGLRTHAFNNVLWPDFSAIPSPSAPVLRFRTLAEEAEQRVGDLWVTPVPVDHTVPTVGFIIHDGEVGFIYSGDTGVVVESPGGSRAPIAAEGKWRQGAQGLLCMRPESLGLVEAAMARGPGFPGTVALRVFEGTRHMYEVDIGGGAKLGVELPAIGESHIFRLGDAVRVEISSETAILLPPD